MWVNLYWSTKKILSSYLKQKSNKETFKILKFLLNFFNVLQFQVKIIQVMFPCDITSQITKFPL